jgi:murein DD-endopeptidase MepM/ murein hydrolase activator NlpD
MADRGITRRGTHHYHRGIDIPAPTGTPVRASEGGEVFEVVDSFRPGYSGYGKVVVILSPRGIYYLYGHLHRITVAKGQQVKTGQQIGEVGATAYRRDDPTGNTRSGAPHLHFETSDSAYPKPAEAERLDPVAVLAQLPQAAAVPAAVTQVVKKGGGALFGGFLLVIGLIVRAIHRTR